MTTREALLKDESGPIYPLTGSDQVLRESGESVEATLLSMQDELDRKTEQSDIDTAVSAINTKLESKVDTSTLDSTRTALEEDIAGKSDKGHGHDAATSESDGFMTTHLYDKLISLETEMGDVNSLLDEIIGGEVQPVRRGYRLMILQGGDKNASYNNPPTGPDQCTPPDFFLSSTDKVLESTEFYLWRKIDKQYSTNSVCVSYSGGAGANVAPYYTPIFADPVGTTDYTADFYRNNPVKIIPKSMGDSRGTAIGGYYIGDGYLHPNFKILCMKQAYKFTIDASSGIFIETGEGITLGNFLLNRFVSMDDNTVGFKANHSRKLTLNDGYYHKQRVQFALSTTLKNPIFIPFELYLIVTYDQAPYPGYHGTILRDGAGDKKISLRAKVL